MLFGTIDAGIGVIYAVDGGVAFTLAGGVGVRGGDAGVVVVGVVVVVVVVCCGCVCVVNDHGVCVGDVVDVGDVGIGVVGRADGVAICGNFRNLVMIGICCVCYAVVMLLLLLYVVYVAVVLVVVVVVLMLLTCTMLLYV